jgi:hypothetical protein
VNVCNEGGPILVFREPPESRRALKETKAQMDSAYLDHIRNREFSERAAAKRASSPAARQVHQELAQAYARMIKRATGK